MSATLLGPNGEPLLSMPDTELALRKVAMDVVEQTIAKQVRHRATTLSSVWDRHRGKPKPTPITFDTLRMMSLRNEWVRAIVKTRKNQIGKAKWSFKAVDKDDTSASTQNMVDALTKLFQRPSMHGSRPNSRSWRQFIGEVLEDVLVIDAGCIEKERDGYGMIVALYPVDGSTIRPNIDEYGGFEDDAYVQIIDGQVSARFGLEDMVYIMDNPQTDIRFTGYGLSPLESLVVSVTAELLASKYNSSYFEKGAVPEGLLNLGEDVSPEDVDAFRLYWMNEIMGKPWALPIIGGSKGVSWEPWRQPNRDMQFMEYQSWLLKKMCAVYQIAPQEVGELEDVNRSTANEQDDTNETKSIEPILTLLKDYIDVEIVGPHGCGLGDYIEFVWEEDGDNEAEIINRFTVMIPMGAATRAEFRAELGMETPEDDTIGVEGLDMFLTDGQPTPLPSKEDTDVMGAAAEKQAADEQQQKEMEQQGGAGTMPWKPAQDGDPALAREQDAHRQANAKGVGPMQNQVPDQKPQLSVAKTDRNPAMTATQDDMDAIFARQHERLIEGLAGILVPAEQLEEVEKSAFTPHSDHGTNWPSHIKSADALRGHLLSQSAKHGGAWVAHNDFGAGKQYHYRNRSAVPEHFRGNAHHHDGLAVNGKWQDWTEAQKIKGSMQWGAH